MPHHRGARLLAGIAWQMIVLMSAHPAVATETGSDADAPATALSGQRIFYVDQAGGLDSNDGRDAARAWKSIGRIDRETFEPGDTILFRRGDRWNEPLSPRASGVAGEPITFGAYGEGAKPVLDGRGAWANGISTNGVSHIVIRDLEITGYTDHGIGAVNASGWVVENVHVHDCGDGLSPDYGVRFFGVPADRIGSEIRILNNRIGTITRSSPDDDVGHGGVLVQSVTDAVIAGNEIATLNSPAIASTPGAKGIKNARVTVRDNVIERSTAGVIMWATVDGAIRNNEIRDGAGCGVCVSFGSERVVVSDNDIHDLTKGARLWNGIDINGQENTVEGVVRGNTIARVHCHSLRIEDPLATRWAVLDNTFDATENTTGGCHGRKLPMGIDSVLEESNGNTLVPSGDGNGDGTSDRYVVWDGTSFHDLDSWQSTSGFDPESTTQRNPQLLRATPGPDY